MNPSKNSIRIGDMFRLGDHLLGCGDARDKKFVAKLVGKANAKVKSVICDVPYGIAVADDDFKKFSVNKALANDHIQSDEEYAKFTRDWIEAIKPHLEKKNSFYIFNSDKMIFALRNGMLGAGMKFGQLLVWVKTQAVVARMDYIPQHELVAYGWVGTHEFMKAKDKSVIVCPRPAKSPFHPTSKPLSIIRRLILNSTVAGDMVFDGFVGGGTAILACEQTRRKCIAIELDFGYCRTVIDRFEKATNIKAVKI